MNSIFTKDSLLILNILWDLVNYWTLMYLIISAELQVE
jgi:hypothetical protein